MNASDVAAYAARAGFTGDNLVWIVAIAGRESGYDANAQGDLGIQTDVWGPSVGLYQIRTLKAQTGTGADRDIKALLPNGVGNAARQSAAAFTISAGGVNRSPWSTNAGLTAQQLADAQKAVDALPPSLLPPGDQGSSTFHSSGGGTVGGIVDAMSNATDQALGALVGSDQPFSVVVVSLVVRGVEILAGAAILAVAGIMILDLLADPSTAGSATGTIGRTVSKTRQLVTYAVAAAAA